MLKTVYTPKKVVKEAYFGTSKNLEEGVKQLEIIVKKIKACNYIQLIKLNVNESPENKKFQECLKKEFGFKDMNLFWDNSSVPNAFTVSGGFIFDSAPNRIIDAENRQKNRYYDHEHRYVCNVVVYMYLVKRLDLTPRETMAIILHEIGHNFDICLPTQIAKCSSFVLTSGVIDLARMATKYIKMPLEGLVQNRLPFIKKMFTVYKELKYHLNILPGNLLGTIEYILTSPQELLTASLKYNGEKFSDKFAATYGFGPDLSSALNKMSDPTKMKGAVKSTIYTIPILRSYYDLLDSSCCYFAALLDEHPHDEIRILTINQKLKKDLADPKVPEKLKEQIRMDIKNNEKYCEMQKNMTGREWAIMSTVYKKINIWLFETAGGDIDPRAIISDIISLGKPDEL